MDIGVLAQQATALLAPALPFLLDKGGGKAVEEIGKHLGEATWTRAQQLWSAVSPKFEQHPAVAQAASDVGAMSGDEDAVAALRHQLKKLLSADAELQSLVAQALANVPPTSSVVASGERSVAVGGSMHGSRISTGDRR